MPTPGVVEPLDVVKDICTRFIPRLVLGAKHSFNLQRLEEALHCRFVPAHIVSAHAAGYAQISQQALVVLAGIHQVLSFHTGAISNQQSGTFCFVFLQRPLHMADLTSKFAWQRAR